MYKEIVAYFVKRLAEIHYQYISLFSSLHVLCQIVDKFYQLSFAGAFGTEPMLQFVQDVIPLCMAYDVASHYVLYDLTAYACKGNRPIVHFVVFFPFWIRSAIANPGPGLA